jgi:hypothetical protein
MAIARNKKNPPVDPSAIAAFGAAAEAHVEPPQPPAPAVSPKVRTTTDRSTAKKNTADDKAPPQASLVRWAGEEETRDRLLAYAHDERYKMQDLMVKAMQLGMDQLENR